VAVLSARRRLPLLLGFVALVCGTGAGLARVGVGVPDAMAGISALHGPLMIGGFLGTVIALERAVAIARPWVFELHVVEVDVAFGEGSVILFHDGRANLHGSSRCNAYAAGPGGARSEQGCARCVSANSLSVNRLRGPRSRL
jgi:hypothetical protein